MSNQSTNPVDPTFVWIHPLFSIPTLPPGFLLGAPSLFLLALPPTHSLYCSHRVIAKSKCDHINLLLEVMFKIPSIFPIPFRLQSKQLSIAHGAFLPLAPAFCSNICSNTPHHTLYICTTHAAQYLTKFGVPKYRTAPVYFSLCPQPPLPLPHGARLTPHTPPGSALGLTFSLLGFLIRCHSHDCLLATISLFLDLITHQAFL